MLSHIVKTQRAIPIVPHNNPIPKKNKQVAGSEAISIKATTEVKIPIATILIAVIPIERTMAKAHTAKARIIDTIATAIGIAIGEAKIAKMTIHRIWSPLLEPLFNSFTANSPIISAAI